MKIFPIDSDFTRFKFGKFKSRCRIFQKLLSVSWCRIGPESRHGTRQEFTVAEIIEIAKKIKLTSNMLDALEIIVSDYCSQPLQVIKGVKLVWK